MKRQLVAALTAFALTTTAAKAGGRPFAADGDAQWSYLDGKIEQVQVSKPDIMRFVGNVFNFTRVIGKDSEIAWKRAADAALDLAKNSPADFARLDCLAGMAIDGLVYVTPLQSPMIDRGIRVNGDFKRQLQTLRASNITFKRAGTLNDLLYCQRLTKS